VGGLGAICRPTFAFAAQALEPPGVPADVPTPMHHPRADIAVTAGPRVTAPAIAAPPRMLFWAGHLTEQALVVNVRGVGLVLISGCGHPRIEEQRITAASA
jgi:7,8-dihydropterin-6-yl-methyl-4-(beta-D-ribofuranosyl)aminobenzene 5'-phosphate synthase